MKQAYEDDVKAFPNELCEHQTALKQCSWPPTLPEIINSLRAHPFCMQTKIRAAMTVLCGQTLFF